MPEEVPEDRIEDQEAATITTETDRKEMELKRQPRKVVKTRPILKEERRTAEATEAEVEEVAIEDTMTAIRIMETTHLKVVLIPSIETTTMPLKEVKLTKVVSVF